MIRLDRVDGCQVFTGIAAVDVYNGNVVAKGALRSDGESYTVAASTDATADDLYIVANVPLQYSEPAKEVDYVATAGTALRLLGLVKGNIISVDDTQITNATVVGKYVEGDESLKLTAVTTVTSGANLAFKVIAKETVGVDNTAVSVLEVI